MGSTIQAMLEAFKFVISEAKKDFKVFAFIISISLNAWLVWLAFHIIAELQLERQKNDQGCDLRIAKIELAFTLENKILKSDNDTLRKMILDQRIEFNSAVILMKKDQQDI